MIRVSVALVATVACIVEPSPESDSLLVPTVQTLSA
jgi:hypothetical protein